MLCFQQKTDMNYSICAIAPCRICRIPVISYNFILITKDLIQKKEMELSNVIKLHWVYWQSWSLYNQHTVAHLMLKLGKGNRVKMVWERVGALWLMVSPMLFISRKLLALFMPDVKEKWISSVLNRLLRSNYLHRTWQKENVYSVWPVCWILKAI